jgi:hypothetical protein
MQNRIASIIAWKSCPSTDKWKDASGMLKIVALLNCLVKAGSAGGLYGRPQLALCAHLLLTIDMPSLPGTSSQQNTKRNGTVHENAPVFQ